MAPATGSRANLSESAMGLAVVDFRGAYCGSGSKPLGIRGGSSWLDGLHFGQGIDIDGRLQPGQEWVLEVTDQARTPLFHIRISTGKLN